MSCSVFEIRKGSHACFLCGEQRSDSGASQENSSTGPRIHVDCLPLPHLWFGPVDQHCPGIARKTLSRKAMTSDDFRNVYTVIETVST